MLEVILSSVLVSGSLSALISYFVSWKLKSLDFKNEYYKEILKKRLEAYEFIERQISVLKGTVLDEEDGRPYQLILGFGKEKFREFQTNLIIAMSKSLWIDEDTVHSLEELNSLFYKINNRIEGKSEEEVIEISKNYYLQLSKARQNLELTMKKGLYNLHDMKKAFKAYNYRKKRVIEI